MTKIHRLSYLILMLTLLSVSSFALQGCSESWNAAKTWKGAFPEHDPNDPTANRPDRLEVTETNIANPTRATANQQNLPPIKVAILLPLSGQHNALGNSMLQAAQMALFEMGYENFELIPRDTKATAEGAHAAAQSALNENPQLIIGPIFANSVRAVQSVTQGKNINIISFSTDWTLAQNNTYLMGFMPFAQVDRIASYASGLKLKNYGIIAPINKYGDTVTSAFKEKVARNGGIISKEARYMPSANNLSAQIKSFAEKSSSLDAIFIPVGGAQAETIAGLLSYHGLTPNRVKYLGSGLWDDKRLMNEHNLRGGIFAGPSPRLRKDFEKRYQALYSKAPIRLASLAYDATALAAVLAQKGNGNYAFNKPSLTNPNGFSGTDGIFRFNQNGLVERGLAILEFSGGGIVEISPAPRSFQ
ncbi:MAG: penicillin-binding protein activator [Micavibrio sp.]|nr:penicillin-binding protein activator [Micavibrio sp.]